MDFSNLPYPITNAVSQLKIEVKEQIDRAYEGLFNHAIDHYRSGYGMLAAVEILLSTRAGFIERHPDFNRLAPSCPYLPLGHEQAAAWINYVAAHFDKHLTRSYELHRSICTRWVYRDDYTFGELLWMHFLAEYTNQVEAMEHFEWYLNAQQFHYGQDLLRHDTEVIWMVSPVEVVNGIHHPAVLGHLEEYPELIESEIPAMEMRMKEVIRALRLY